jgi:LmbE family N-acetylglucosaminyl deacetylase
MKAFEFDPQFRWLFCMTHPDDEISICATIKRLTDAGNEVHVSWTHSTPVRRAEALRVAEILGVPQQRLYFHAGGDGHICDEMPHLLESFRVMVNDVQPDRIACGAFEQGHLDHDATNLLVNRAFDGPVLEIPFYHTYLSRKPKMNRFAEPEGQEILHLTYDEQCLKVKVAKLYPSTAIWRNLLLDEIRRRIIQRREEPLRRTERMRLQTHKDFLTPNLPELLAARVRRSRKWRRWEAAAQAIL